MGSFIAQAKLTAAEINAAVTGATVNGLVTGATVNGLVTGARVDALLSVDMVANRVAQVAVGALSSTVFAYSTEGDKTAGQTVAGSSLRLTSAARMAENGQGAAFTEQSGMSGTWVCMGRFDSVITESVAGSSQTTHLGATEWKRIA